MLLTGLLVVLQPVSAAEYSVHAGPNGYAPFFIVKRDGENVEYSGAIYDLLDVFEAENPGLKRRYVLQSLKRANLSLARGELYDLMLNSPTFVSDEVLDHYQFTTTLFDSSDIVVSLRADNFEYQQPSDLFGKTVVGIRGYSYGLLDEHIASGAIGLVSVDSHEQAIGMLEKKRVDAYFGNLYVTPFYIRKMQLERKYFKFSKVAMYQFDFAFLVRRSRTEFYEKLNEFVIRVRYDGTFKRLLSRYLN